jgi:hypothetical protein
MSLSALFTPTKSRLASLGVAGTLFASALFPTAAAFAASSAAAANTAAGTEVPAQDIASALDHAQSKLAIPPAANTTSDSRAALKAAAGGATVTAPNDASNGVELGAPNNGPVLNVQLPNARQDGNAEKVGNGVVAYAGANGSANAVRATADGGVQLLTIIDSPDAPTSYDYKISVPNGGTIELTKTGGASVLNTKGTVIASVAAPWATDAAGKTITTYFTTDGQTLTQHIEHNVSGVVYPVTADPWLSWGWNLYVNFNWWETQNIKHYQEVGYFGWGLAAYVCSKIPYWPAEVACTVITLYEGAQLAWAVRNASDTNSCLQLAIPYFVLSNPWLNWPAMHWGWARC